ncbi:MAG TPA: SDR family oxidoreductase [Chitinophagaceae bacterium]|nr:SDR family oxidoreductase [Chitinophagaceae bacterium]
MAYFKNKVVWITGASSGIGEALAIALSGAGALVILSSRRFDELERVRKACTNKGNVKIVTLDLLDTASLAAKTAEAIAAFGHIDVMVHNGGISQRSLVADTGMQVQRKVMEIDYFSYVELTNHILPHFIQRGSGCFVVMSSVMGKIGTPMRGAYAAAKHALHGFFDCLRAEVFDKGIQVTVLTPGYIRTNVTMNAVTGDGTPLNKVGENIGNGLPAEKAAQQIMKAVENGKFEAYIGKPGNEKLALIVNRFMPNLLHKMVRKQLPK